MYKVEGFRNFFNTEANDFTPRLVLEIPLVLGFNFGTNILQLAYPDGRIVVFPNDFARVEFTPLAGAPEEYVEASNTVQ